MFGPFVGLTSAQHLPAAAQAANCQPQPGQYNYYDNIEVNLSYSSTQVMITFSRYRFSLSSPRKADVPDVAQSEGGY